MYRTVTKGSLLVYSDITHTVSHIVGQGYQTTETSQHVHEHIYEGCNANTAVYVILLEQYLHMVTVYRE